MAKTEEYANGVEGKEAAKAGAVSPLSRLVECVLLLQRGVRSKDSRLLSGRLMRQTAGVRPDLTPSLITQLISSAMWEGNNVRTTLLKHLEEVSISESSSMLID